MARFVVLLLCLALSTALFHHSTLSRRDRFSAEEDILYLPKVSALKVMALGHHELVASLVFVRALVYFGGEISTQERKFTWLDNYLDTIVTLDPKFELAYRWAGTATMYNGRPITNEMVERANHFLKRGAGHFPTSWQLPWMIGCNYMFELQTSDPKQKREWERIGADWIRQAALVGSAPPWAALLAAQVMRKEGQTEASIKYLEEVYLTTSDDSTKAQIRNRLISLRQQAMAEGLESKARSFTSAWQANLPYAPPDLYVAIGDPPSRRMDPDWLGRDELLIEAQRSEEAMRKEN